MINKLITILCGILIAILLILTEYRLIMHNIKPYLGENNTVYLEIFGITDEYYIE